MNDFEKRVARRGEGILNCVDIETIQVNLGLLCNLRCRHCHVNASPDRTEIMSWETMELILEAADRLGEVRFDLTGGAPELNPNFRRFVAAIRDSGYEASTRTNLTVLLAPGIEGTAEFLRDHSVALIGSMPCYLEENVAAQRGQGAYGKCVEALRLLNSLGYGLSPELPLSLVYNPTGAFLPPDQEDLERDYRAELMERFGIEFTRLITIANMPIGRFLDDLRGRGEDGDYMAMLKDSFNPETIEKLMCRRQISVRWDGELFDCDFNLALGYSLNHGAPDTLVKFDPAVLRSRRIVTGDHCFGCTAGAGSSCNGSIA